LAGVLFLLNNENHFLILRIRPLTISTKGHRKQCPRCRLFKLNLNYRNHGLLKYVPIFHNCFIFTYFYSYDVINRPYSLITRLFGCLLQSLNLLLLVFLLKRDWSATPYLFQKTSNFINQKSNLLRSRWELHLVVFSRQMILNNQKINEKTTLCNPAFMHD